MKSLRLTTLLLLISSLAWGVTPPTPGSGATNVNAQQGASITLDINVGDSAIIFVNTNSGTAPTISDNGSTSNSYTQVGIHETLWGNQYAFYVLSATHSATTVTSGGTGTPFCIMGATFVNVSAIGATHESHSSAGSPASDSVTTTKAESLVVGGFNGDALTAFTATQSSVVASSLGGGNTVTEVLLTQTVAASGTSATSSGTFTPIGNTWELQSIELQGTTAVSGHCASCDIS